MYLACKIILNSSILVVTSLLSTPAEKVGEKSSECNQDILDRSFVTQCGPSRCETVLERDKYDKRSNEWPSNKNEVVHITSSREDDRFKVHTYKAIDTTDFYYEESHINGTIFVETEVQYQRILGFGTTLTDASCKNADDLPTEIRGKLISDYFSTEEGIGLNLIKVPIGSTKFSYTNYVLDQPDSNQVELSPYDIDQRIPIIKDAMKVAGKLKNRVKILASSATAPAEMKQNHKIIHGGFLGQDRFQNYASYLIGFITAYKSHGLSVWSLILSESPVSVARLEGTNDTLDYNSLAMRPSDTIKLVRAINEIRSKRTELDKFRMLLLGDSRNYLPVWADAILQQNDIKSNVAGIAYVCDGPQKFSPYDNLMYATKRYPNKYLLATQGSTNTPIKLGNWQYAENYATEIVKNLEYGSVGWVDFNLALNLEGGPCINDRFKSDAAIIVDPRRGTFYRNPMFYAIGHLSRYVKPGSVRVKINFLSSAHMFANQYIAFITPDNYLVVFIMNNNIGPMPVSIGINKRTKVESLLATKSFNTFIFRL